MNINTGAGAKKKSNQSAAPQNFEPCDRVTALEPCTVKTVSDGVYFIDIDEEIAPSRYNSEIQYFIDED